MASVQFGDMPLGRVFHTRFSSYVKTNPQDSPGNPLLKTNARNLVTGAHTWFLDQVWIWEGPRAIDAPKIVGLSTKEA